LVLQLLYVSVYLSPYLPTSSSLSLVRNRLHACLKIYACEMHACERHACEMHAYEMAACEMHAYEMAAYERHTYEMAHGRYTPVGEARL
jgi:hypothetical protein